MSPGPVIIYLTEWCGYCRRAKSLLASKGVEWSEVNLDAEPERRGEMVARAGGRRTVPQIFAGQRHLGGFDDIAELERQGQLDEALGL